jgi:hypothetical protein
VKRDIMFPILFLILIISVAAQDFSLGGSVGYAYGLDYHRIGNDSKQGHSHLLSSSIFVDFTYGLFSVGVMQTLGGSNLLARENNDSIVVDQSIGITSARLHLAAKYPFDLGEGHTLSPLLGFSYWYNLQHTDATNGFVKTDYTDQRNAEFSDFWVDTGVLWDIDLDSQSFLRFGGYLSYNLNTFQQELLDLAFCRCLEYQTFGLGAEIYLAYGFRR